MKLLYWSLGLLLGFFSSQRTVDGDPVNLALKGDATQSSTYGLWFAEKAVDGNLGRTNSWQYCASTNYQTDPWWRVDLQHLYCIGTVVITSRSDCCDDRLNGTEIRIGNSLENNGNNNSLCAVVSHIPAGVSFNFTCDGLEGRYVNLINHGNNKCLTLCEVQVYSEGPCVKQTLVKIRLKSSMNLSDGLLMQLESALEERGVDDITLRWTQLPKQEVMQQAPPAQCAQSER